eukprot:TRINITY_DN17942_c0_g2_i2.p1 TRINITY_DN17942_c0_g2~~TRINITY_DN17942_c0_g2_i2.p1  ORF type:complete len:648 (+),score=150.71 TRINITY_DN17942_c0_g2_i2:183-2126(+)
MAEDARLKRRSVDEDSCELSHDSGEEDDCAAQDEDGDAGPEDLISPRKPPPDEDAKLAREAHDWMESVFGCRSFATGWRTSDDFRMAFARMPQQMKLDCKHSRALSKDVVLLLQRWLVEDATQREEGQIWPLIKTAKLWGPWEVLRGPPNIVFKDLPGTGDANAVRNGIAQREFSSADFVCICSRVDRAVTDSASLEWLHKSKRDHPAGSCAYIVTKCDDVNKAEVVRDHGLKHHTQKAQAASTRNDKLKSSMVATHGVPVYCISARDYVRCVGLEDALPETFCNEAGTEVSKLRLDIVDAMGNRHVKAERHLMEALQVQLQVMQGHTVEMASAAYNSDELSRVFESLLGEVFLARLNTASEKLQAELSQRRQDLNKTAKDAANNADSTLASKGHFYGPGSSMHWARHKALIVRDGDYSGMSISGDIAHPIVKDLDGPWASLFNDVPATGQRLRSEILENGKKFVTDFAERLAEWPEARDHARMMGKLTLKSLGVHLRDELKVLDDNVLELRGGYAERLQADLKSGLAHHLADAKYNYSGKGSVAGRKDSVRRSLPNVDVHSALRPPRDRVRDLMKLFARFCRNALAHGSEKLRCGYSEFWETNEERSADVRAKRAVLHERISAELATLEQAGPFAAIDSKPVEMID